MKQKRFLSGLLALALVLCLLPGRVGVAQAASFTDISDSATAENVEILRMLGVLDGTSTTTFAPNGTLTRAQVAKMAIVALGKKGSVAQYSNVTIYPDVRASHWAAGYINLAVRGEDKLMIGYPDGNFHPDQEITFGQTVTILMRMLGYQDSDVGAVWPQGYLAKAAAIGLTDGVNLNANDKVTRAQAAQLFRTLLETDQKDGTKFYTKLGTTVPDVILLSVDATADDGTKNAIRTQDGKIYKVADRTPDASIAGEKGTLLLNSAGRVLTFLPAKGSSHKTITLSEAMADGLVDVNGTKYTLHSTSVTYYQGEQKNYSDVFYNLRAGTTVTLYFDASGNIEYLFAGASTTAAEAVIVTATGSTAGFEKLTNSTSYTIYKDGALVTARDLRQYDVATYDAASNTIRVSDTRLTGYYENAEPNQASPTKVRLLGKDFDVLTSAADSLSAFRVGEQVTLLLTEDARVAGAADPSKVKGDAVGVATSVSTTSATVALLNGLTIQGNPGLSSAGVGQYIGQLVRVTSTTGGGRITLSLFSGGSVRDSLNVVNRTLGTSTLADNVVIYDKVGAGPVMRVSLSEIPFDTLPASKMLYAQKDYLDRVSVLVLNNATGDGYTYGIFNYTAPKYDEDGEWLANATISVTYGDGLSTITADTTPTYSNGTFGGLAVYTDGSSTGRVAGRAEVKKLEDVPQSAWNGSDSVTVRGTTYMVPESVVCYNATTKTWLTLSQARAYADSFDLYYDTIGEKIRIVVVK